ncbi:MAG: thiamine-phosphate kinase [Bacteroidota bacterium]
MSEPRTELNELGEFGLIDFLTKNIRIRHPQTIKGVGDDAAVISPDKGKQVLVSTDMLVEGTHFDLSYTPLKHLGYKAVVVNLSDITAMNGRPYQITVSVGLSNRFSLEAVDQLYQGIYLACEHYNIDLVGGDTTSSPSGLIISITAIGEASAADIVYRNGAKENDLIVVSGDLGAAYLGLQLLAREKEVFLSTGKQVQPDLEGHDYILERQLKPEARTDIIELLKALDVKPGSMIDISDGLSSEILHLCHNSKTGCSIYEEKLPVDPTAVQFAHELGLDPTTCALNGGEDYELLFTIDLKDYEKIKGNPNLSVIGHMTDLTHGSQLITKGGGQEPLKAQGWNALLETQNLPVKEKEEGNEEADE